MKVTADYRNSIDFDTLLRKREKGRGTGKERHRENVCVRENVSV